MSAAVRSTALRAGGACVRCRKGKTKCVYENGRAPCKNCAKGLHECYLPSESMSHGGHGVSPARIHQARVRESLPSERAVSGVAGDRQGVPASSVSRHVSSTAEKYVLSISWAVFSSFLLFIFFYIYVPRRRLPHFPPLFRVVCHRFALVAALPLVTVQPVPGSLHAPFLPGLHILALPLGASSQAPFLRPASILQITHSSPPCSVRPPVPIPNLLAAAPQQTEFRPVSLRALITDVAGPSNNGTRRRANLSASRPGLALHRSLSHHPHTSFVLWPMNSCFVLFAWCKQSITQLTSYGARDRLTPELLQECERVISKTLPACVAFHKPSFLQQLKNTSMEPTMVNALLTTAAR